MPQGSAIQGTTASVLHHLRLQSMKQQGISVLEGAPVLPDLPHHYLAPTVNTAMRHTWSLAGPALQVFIALGRELLTRLCAPRVISAPREPDNRLNLVLLGHSV